MNGFLKRGEINGWSLVPDVVGFCFVQMLVSASRVEVYSFDTARTFFRSAALGSPRPPPTQENAGHPGHTKNNPQLLRLTKAWLTPSS
eukprot:2890206-Amphidinium_carterae.1